MPIDSPASTASARRTAARSMSVSVDGSGSAARRLGARKVSTASTPMPRPATTRATTSGRPWRWAIAIAVASPAMSRRGRQRLPVTEAATSNSGRSSSIQRGPVAAVRSCFAAIASMPDGSRPQRDSSIVLELLEVEVHGLYEADGAGRRAHHHRVRLDAVALEGDAVEEVAVGDAGGGEEDVTGGHLRQVVLLVRLGDAHAFGAGALLLGVEDQPALHLAADAAQRRRGEHALGSTADADVNVDAGLFRVGGVDDAGDVAVADQADRRTRGAHGLDQGVVSRPIHDAGGDLADRHALRLGERGDVVGGRSVEVDEAGRVA
eukprot:Opistho-1_new@19395